MIITNFDSFIKDRNQPVVFKNFINEWPARKWTLSYLAQYLKDTEIKCKIGPKYQGLFETQCLYLDITIEDFIEWCSDKKSRPSNPLHQIDKDKYFCYLDYKYMVKLFSDNEDILQSIDWGVFGLTDRNGSDSTIWIGSDGCTTPCHYDTYGFNLVSQISGRKKWYLFPPSDTESLYPTRIPYEESSVFSQVNITNTDFSRHPLFKDCHPYMVILEPGDVLYVPKHWWHYVECLETAISVNTWVEMEDDNETRVKEAITRILISSLTSSNTASNNSLVNPTEILQSYEVNFEYFQKALENMDTFSKQEADGSGTEPKTQGDGNTSNTYDVNREAMPIDGCHSNKFQQFCDKFQSWRVYDFEGRNRLDSTRKRKFDETNEQISSKISEADASGSEIDSERQLSISAKYSSEIFTVSKCELSDLHANKDSDNSSDKAEISNTDQLIHKLIKSILKPNVIDMIYEEFNK